MTLTTEAAPSGDLKDLATPVVDTTSLAIVGRDARFPVRRVYCVGRNYLEHIREMKESDERDPPFFFQKPTDSIVADGIVPYPTMTDDLQYEAELVVAIGAPGHALSRDAALGIVFGYAVGLDMTRRDLQGEAKELRRPWELGKAFEFSAPCSEIAPASEIGHPAAGEIWLDVNGERKQSGDLNQLIWKVPEMISYLSGLFTLAPGDIIMSGTPAGVGAIKPGDIMHGYVEGVGELHTPVR
jgi:fumarylpyruvate hydrolase